MDLGFDLNLEQKQQLIMTPKLQTAIKILQYNSQELAEYIEEEVNENPLLELIEDKKELDYDQVSSTDFNETNSTNYENYVAYRPNLYEYLEKQLYQVLDKSKLYIGEYIVGNLNEHGFLEIAVTEIAAKYNVSVKAVNGILEKIQYLDPIGIAARNIKESLLIQLKSLKIHTKTAEEIVENYMDELAEGKYRLIKKKIGKNKKEVLAAINLIKTLNPYPVSDFYDKKETEYILPDLIIKELDGKFVVISNEKTSPGLKINSYYYRMLKNKVEDKAHEYLEKKYKAALWLIKSIEQRRMTIYRIAQTIIKKQLAFFKEGIKSMVTMTMEEVADTIGIHESTVSRATTDKYVQTPHGLFELKFFFSSGIKNISSISIKAIISEYIKKEDKSSPLSDSALKEVLKKEKDINISRRTVAKYRNQMGVYSSQKRRKRKE